MISQTKFIFEQMLRLENEATTSIVRVFFINDQFTCHAWSSPNHLDNSTHLLLRDQQVSLFYSLSNYFAVMERLFRKRNFRNWVHGSFTFFSQNVRASLRYENTCKYIFGNVRQSINTGFSRKESTHKNPMLRRQQIE